MREWENAHRKRISLSSKTVFWHWIRFELLSHMHMHKPTSPAPCHPRPKPDADANANAPSQPSPTHGRLRNSRAQISEIARAQIERIEYGIPLECADTRPLVRTAKHGLAPRQHGKRSYDPAVSLVTMGLLHLRHAASHRNVSLGPPRRRRRSPRAELADPGPADVRDMLETKLTGLGRVGTHRLGSRLASQS